MHLLYMSQEFPGRRAVHERKLPSMLEYVNSKDLVKQVWCNLKCPIYIQILIT